MIPHEQTKGVTDGTMYIIHLAIDYLSERFDFFLLIFQIKRFNFFLMCIFVLVCVDAMEAEEGIRSSGAGVTEHCELSMWVPGSEVKCAGRAVSSLMAEPAL